MNLDTIYEQEYDRVLAYFLTALTDKGRAEDLTAETFLTMHRLIERGLHIEDKQKITRFVIRVAKNKLRHEKRRIARQTKAGIELAAPEALVAEEESLGAPLTGWHAPTLEDIEFRVDFDHAVRALTPKQRDAFILTDLRGLTEDEAARILGVTQQAVSERRIKARTHIKSALG